MRNRYEKSIMPIKLDHVFILTEPGAEDADLLLSAGLVEGANNRHPGQGTANRRFFFANTTLEFLYVHDATESANGLAKGLRFVERCSAAGASPFGLVMKTVQRDSVLPFDGWQYCPEYFANDQCFHVGKNSDVIEEPLCIVMPSNLAPRKSLPVPEKVPENMSWLLTELKISVPVVQPSTALSGISKCEWVTVIPDTPHCLELTFNNAVKGKTRDFRAQMPLIMNW